MTSATITDDEAASRRPDESRREHHRRGRHAEPLALHARRRLPFERTDRDSGDHDQTKRTQQLSLATQALFCPHLRLQLPAAPGCRLHSQTIERAPARRSGPGANRLPAARHAAASLRPRACTIAIREPTSTSAIRTNAAGQAAAPI